MCWVKVGLHGAVVLVLVVAVVVDVRGGYGS
jgi:hypothetical protein